MSELTLEEAKAMVREILTSAPNTRFPDPDKCIYFNEDGSPCCAVGHVFARIGITLPPPVEYCGVPVYTYNTIVLSMLREVWNGKISVPAAEFLTNVQEMQDRGTPWGEIAEMEYVRE